MCLIVFARQCHAHYPLILLANRDEFYQRATCNAHFWTDTPNVLAGKDLVAGGTWLGVSRSGRIAALTNYREAHSHRPATGQRSRGELCSDYLGNQEEPARYLKMLAPQQAQYAGFNLLLGSVHQLWWTSNRQTSAPTSITPGIHGLSNGYLNQPWPKVERSKKQLQGLIQQAPDSLDEQAYIELFRDQHSPRDQELPDTGVGIELERMLSPIFIQSERYGTRATTLLTVDVLNRVTLLEAVFDERGEQQSQQRFSFRIET